MMSVGPPTQTHPDQVTTKPRQMPSGGGNTMGNPMGVPGADGNPLPGQGDEQPAPGQFDPAAAGMDVDAQRAEDNDTTTNKEDTAGDEQPGESFTAAMLPRIEAMATDVVTANPGIDIQSALKISVSALSDVLRTEGGYDSSAWHHDFNVSGSPLQRAVDRYQVKKVYGPRHVGPDGKPGKPMTSGDMIQHTVNKGVELAGQGLNTVVDKLREKMGPPRPQHAPGQGLPLPPDGPDAPEDRKPDVSPDQRPKDDPNPEPYQDSSYDEPKTMGEWVRGQMAHYGPEAVRDLWRLRYDPRPAPHRAPEGESR